MANEQALFDAALAHIRQQGQPSFDAEEATCAYRMPDGRGCAFAPAIADYNVALEGRRANYLLRDNPARIKPEFREVDKDFANAVQSAHDDAVLMHPDDEFMERFEGYMRSLAALYRLTYTEPK